MCTCAVSPLNINRFPSNDVHRTGPRSHVAPLVTLETVFGSMLKAHDRGQFVNPMPAGHIIRELAKAACKHG
jgi:hypothetical protein